jgi:hypothetical protein
MQNRWYHAGLSFILPGWGQFERGDRQRGHVFLWWTVGTLLVAPLVLALGIPVWLIIVELVVATLWSAADAFARDRAHRLRGERE